jgi:hypothetical protein
METNDRIEALERIAAAAGAATIPVEPVAGERVRRRIDEGYCALMGCARHARELAAEGLEESEVRRLRILVDALRDAEALAGGAPAGRGGRLALIRDVLYEAVGDAAGRLRARAAFAFRHDGDGERLRLFFGAYAPRVPRPGGRRALCETVELKLR